MKGNENCFELAGGSSYRGFELPGVHCSLEGRSWPDSRKAEGSNPTRATNQALTKTG